MIEQRGKSTPEEKEILNITLEECAEVIQSISKILRFGFESTHPNDPTYSNRSHFEEELGDLSCMMNILAKKNIIDYDAVVRAAQRKLNKLARYSDINLEEITYEV